MSNLSPEGYFSGVSQELVQQVADAITSSWNPAKADRWDWVHLAEDGITYYTLKHSDDQYNEAARELGAVESVGSEDWFSEE